MIFRQLFDYDTWTYTYILADTQSMDGIIIDPVREQHQRDLRLINDLGITLRYILDTHIHADHITGAWMLRNATRGVICMSDASNLDCADLLLSDGQEISFGKHRLKVLETPGHTSESSSFYGEEMVFTGDCLFIRGAGRTDFQGGSPEQQWDSIHNKLFTLPDDTIVYPAHNYEGMTSSTIGEEKAHNPIVGGSVTRESYIVIERNMERQPPKRLAEALPANRQCGRG